MNKLEWKKLFELYRCCGMLAARNPHEKETILRLELMKDDKLGDRMVGRFNAKELAEESGIKFGSLVRYCITNKLRVNAIIAWITGDWAWGVTEAEVDATCLHFYNAAVSTGAFSGTCSEFCYHTYTAEFVANFINIER